MNTIEVTTLRDGIKSLDPHDPIDVENAARLHGELLPSSSVPRLGQTFMQRFYYRKLVEDGLICCDLYYDNDVAVGFLAYTKHPSTFMKLGFRRHAMLLVGLMADAVLRNPQRLSVILSVLGFARLRTNKQTSDETSSLGELLSFGVKPECRSAKYVRKTGRRISLELVEHAKSYFREENVPGFRGLVEANNRETLLFYHAIGCHLQKTADRESEIVEVIYNFDELAAQSA